MALIGKVQRGQPLTADMMNNIIDNIRECQLQSVVGGIFKRGVGGTTITLKAGQQQGEAQPPCPFTAIVTAVTTGFEVSFTIGTVNGLLPSNMFTKITGVTTGARNYFYIKATSDGKAITSAVIEKDTTIRTPPTPLKDVAPAEVNILIATMATSGLVESTISCDNLNARIVPSVQEDNASYVAGERNLSQYYNWIF
jgi:hypothetical protein